MSTAFDAIDLDELRTRRSMKWREFAPDVLPAWVAEMDFPLAAPIRSVLVDMIEGGDTGYAWPGGLVEAFAGFSLRRWGFAPDPARGTVVPDIMQGILVALGELTPPGSGVALLLPAYPPFFTTIEYVGRDVVGVPMERDADGRYAVDLERLESVLARPDVSTFLLCNPHNPTGRVFDRAELVAMAEVAVRHRVLVLSDEVHGPLVYDGRRHIPFGSLGSLAAHSVSLVSASKAWNLPGLKCAAVFATESTWAPFAHLPTEIALGASPLGVAANIAAFEHGEPWLDELVSYLDGNRFALSRLLRERLPEIAYTLPEATYLAWLDCDGLGLGDDPSVTFLERGRVAVNPGRSYGAQVGRGFVRLNFGTSRAILEQIVEQMARAIDR